jgi:hypothetical protein
VAGRDEMIEDYRQFTRDLWARMDRALRDFRAEERARHAEAMARIERLGVEVREQSRRTDELIAEGRAHRAALFAILDELRGNGGPAAAT